MKTILPLQAEVQVLMGKAKEERPPQMPVHPSPNNWRIYRQLILRV